MSERDRITAGGRDPAVEAQPARLAVLLAGAGLSLLGVLGFFYDAGFGTGSELTNDDLAGILLVNGWRNAVYLVTGLAALALASSAPRAVALALACFYTAFAIWGFAATDHGVGWILDALPLGDRDNVLHLVIGIAALLAVVAEAAVAARRRREGTAGGLGSGLGAVTGGRAAPPPRRGSPRDVAGGGPR